MAWIQLWRRAGGNGRGVCPCKYVPIEGKLTSVADEHVDLLTKLCTHWLLSPQGYAYRFAGKGKNKRAILMQWDVRDIMNWSSGIVDHVEPSERLNNHWKNLRPETTPSQNGANSKLRTDSTTGEKNIHWHKRDKRFIVDVSFEGDRYIARHRTLEEAKKDAEAARERLHKKYARFK